MAQCRRQRQTDQRCGHQDRCHTKCDWYTGVHVCVTNTAGIHTGWPLTMSQKFYNYRLAQYQRWAVDWSKTILVLQRWTGCNRWGWVKRQAHSHTNQSQATGARSTSHNHMGIEKMKLLAHESVYWYNISADIEEYIKNCATCLEFQQTQPKEEIIHHDIPLRPWEVLGTDIFHFNNKN